MRNHSLLLWVLLFVDGVFCADEVSVSVMKGDSVTLHTNLTELQSGDTIDWMSEDGVIIAKIENKKISEKYVPERRFKGRLELDSQNGSLTIRNITAEHKGLYILDISGGNLQSKRFNVTIRDEIKTVSVKKGDYIILRTGVIEMRVYDQILWKFEDHLMAEIIKGANQFSLYGGADGRFGGRLHPDHQSGSLTISDSETTDSGDYHLYMSNSMYTLQRTISVTVSGLSSVIVVICVCVALVAVVVLVVFYYQRKLRLERQRRDRNL